MPDKKLYSRGPTHNELNTEGIGKLIEEARDNPQFFHDLVWNTEKTITAIDYLTRQEKASILAIDPESVVVGLVAGARSRLTIEACGVSCGGSCGGTCAASCVGSCAASCGGSCENSCGGTCGGSCGTSCGNSCAGSCAGSCVGSGDRFGDLVTQPIDLSPSDERSQGEIVSQVRRDLKTMNFTRFQR